MLFVPWLDAPNDRNQGQASKLAMDPVSFVCSMVACTGAMIEIITEPNTFGMWR